MAIVETMEASKTRNVIAVLLSIEGLLRLFAHNPVVDGAVSWRVYSLAIGREQTPFPADVRVVSMQIVETFPRYLLKVYLEHPSFPDLEEGSDAPLVPLMDTMYLIRVPQERLDEVADV